MLTRIVLQTLRQRRGAVAGSFVALTLAITIIGSTLIVLISALGDGGVRTQERYDAATALVRADPRVPLPGDDDPTSSAYAATARRMPAELADTAGDVPGAGKVIVDRTFYAEVQGEGTSAPAAPTGQGWSSMAIMPFELTEGREPTRTGEVVLGPDTAERTGAGVGDEVTVVTSLRTVQATVVGLVGGGDEVLGEAGVFFADDVAAELSGAPEHADALAVFAGQDTDASRLVSALRKAFEGKGLLIEPGSESTALSEHARTVVLDDLVAFSAIIATSAGFIAIFVGAGTFAFSITQRQREIALLRAVGASPRQVRRMLLGEAAIIGAVSAVIGCAASLPAGPAMGSAVVSAGLAPTNFEAAPGFLSLLLSLLLGPLIALLAVWVSARRAGRTRPSEALTEVAAPGSQMNRARWITGCLFAALSLLTALLITGLDTEGASALSIVLTYLLVISMVAFAPLIVPVVLTAARPLANRLTRSVGRLASANTGDNVKSTVATATPILITVAIAGTLLGVSSTATATEHADARLRMTADVVIHPTGSADQLPADLVADVDKVAGVDSTTPVAQAPFSVRTEGVAMSSEVAFVDPANLTDAFDLPVREGALEDLRTEGTVALTADGHAVHGYGLGDEVPVIFHDGSTAKLRVVALLGSSGGLPRALMSADRATTAPPPALTSIHVDLAEGADREAVVTELNELTAPAGATADERDAYLSGVNVDVEQNQSITVALLVLALLYCAISIGNTLVMATGQRAGEYRLLRRVGASPRQVLGMLGLETVIVVVTGALLGLLAASGSIIGVRFALGSQTDAATLAVPVLPISGVLLGCLLIALVATLLPAWLLLRSWRPAPGGAIPPPQPTAAQRAESVGR